MNYQEIHQALKARGMTWGVAAEAIGCTLSHLMNVCARRAESPRVGNAVSVLIRKRVADVFPDKPRYQNDPKVQRAERLNEARKQLEKAGWAA